MSAPLECAILADRRPMKLAALGAVALALCMDTGCERRPPLPTDFREALRQELIEKVLPYWYDTSIDTERGGYVLYHGPSKERAVATEKMIVSQARMVWTFSHVHRFREKLDITEGERDYLGAAGQGYRFLVEHLLDQENGGYYWMTDSEGKATNDRKYLYGNAFVVYALVEYHRASGDDEPLSHAMDLYETVQDRWHDPDEGGWFEEGARDFSPLEEADMGYAGHKSANAHLHWMEALTELYEATGDETVGESLAEALDVNRKHFFPLPAGKACYFRRPDWSEVPERPGLSYGHNVEFAWLMVRAERVLGWEPSWDHFDAQLAHALRYGYDHDLGGLYNTGTGSQPASDRSKIWWPQAEMLAALVEGLRHEPDPEYARALDRLLAWLWRYQTDHTDGVWHNTVSAEGRIVNSAKAHVWKAAYHDVRATVKFIVEPEGSTATGAEE